MFAASICVTSQQSQLAECYYLLSCLLIRALLFLVIFSPSIAPRLTPRPCFEFFDIGIVHLTQHGSRIHYQNPGIILSSAVSSTTHVGFEIFCGSLSAVVIIFCAVMSFNTFCVSTISIWLGGDVDGAPQWEHQTASFTSHELKLHEYDETKRALWKIFHVYCRRSTTTTHGCGNREIQWLMRENNTCEIRKIRTYDNFCVPRSFLFTLYLWLFL